MKNSRISLLIIVVSLCLLTIACKPGVPRDIIQPDDMEKLLYDYHVSQAMATEGEGNMEYNERLYKLAVLKKHGVTEAEFDSSLVYYTRHTEQLHKIYQRLSERMNKEALALGASTDEVNRFTLTSTGDTANIWKGDINAALIPYAPYNVISFVIPADTSFRKGDRFMLGLTTRFLYQEGSRDAVAMLAMRFTNDSVVSRTVHMSSDNSYNVEVLNNDTLGVKEIRGFILLTKDRNAATSTLKLLLLDNIHLVRFHMQNNKSNNDSGNPNLPAPNTSIPGRDMPPRPNGAPAPPPPPVPGNGPAHLPHPNQQSHPAALDNQGDFVYFNVLFTALV